MEIIQRRTTRLLEYISYEKDGKSSILELLYQKGRLRGDLIFNTDLQMHKGLI